MDSFGSNATPMGGAAGRCDAMVAAVESQSADGVLHVHLFMYIQMAMQFMTLHQLAQHLREKMLTADALKQYVSHVRRQSSWKAWLTRTYIRSRDQFAAAFGAIAGLGAIFAERDRRRGYPQTS